MRVRVPNDIRTDLRAKVGAIATTLRWQGLPDVERSRLYQQWTEDPEIGGVLSRFLSPNQVRTYIKDTLMKPYARAQLGLLDDVLRTLGIDGASQLKERFTRPHGVLLADGRIVCWGRADDWKQVLMAAFERWQQRQGATPHAVVLLNAVGRFEQDPLRELVQAAATRLGIGRVAWKT